MPWAPEHLDYMLQEFDVHGLWDPSASWNSGYNEIIIESAAWRDSLPHVVEAFFFVEGSSASEMMARKIHQDFHLFYGMNPEDVPLLKLRLTNWELPFESSLGDPST